MCFMMCMVPTNNETRLLDFYCPQYPLLALSSVYTNGSFRTSTPSECNGFLGKMLKVKSLITFM